MFYGALEIVSGQPYYENVDERVFCMTNRVLIEKDFILEMLETEDKLIMNPNFTFTSWTELAKHYSNCSSAVRILVFAEDTSDDFIFDFLLKRVEYIAKTELEYEVAFKPANLLPLSLEKELIGKKIHFTICDGVLGM